MKYVSFDTARALYNQGFRNQTEKGYRVMVDKNEQPEKDARPEFGDYGKLKFNLSDRFYNSWNDVLYPAPSALELTQYDRSLTVNIDSDPDAIARALFATDYAI